MSDTETFLSRWLRLKRESDAALPPPAASSPTAFDATSLPPIDSIVADSDIQPFLQEGVPAELTRAALRSAWSADPAIRDFVGIAENQWNFNDQACIPGFGPLEAADYLAARVLAGLTSAAQQTPQGGESAQQSAPLGTEPLEAARPPAQPHITAKKNGLVETAGVGDTGGVGETSDGETGADAAAPKTHGGALPR
jgi:hypothetical protein